MGILNGFINGVGNLEGQALKKVTGSLNSVGIKTPNYGISAGLTRGVLNPPNQFTANAPFGTSPTQAQQQQIVQNPSMSLADFGSGSAAKPVSQPLTGQSSAPVGPEFSAAAQPAAQAAPTAQTSGIGTPSYYLHNQTVGGQTYNLADPGQQEQYRQAMLGTYGAQRDNAISQLQQSTQQGLSAAQLANAQAMGTQQQNATDYGRSLASNVFNLGEGYNLGQVNNQQQFAGLSPNAFQSSQATSQQYGTDQYNRGLTQLHQGAAENVGNDYLSTGNIDPNSVIGKQIAAEQASYNQYVQQAQNGLQQGIMGANTAYGQAADAQNSNLQNLNAYSGAQQQNYTPTQFNYSGSTTNPVGQFQTPAVNPYNPVGVDISQYTPYTTAQQLSQSPQAQAPSPATYTGSSNPFASLLGYNPSPVQAGYLNAFAGAK